MIFDHLRTALVEQGVVALRPKGLGHRPAARGTVPGLGRLAGDRLPGRGDAHLAGDLLLPGNRPGLRIEMVNYTHLSMPELDRSSRRSPCPPETGVSRPVAPADPKERPMPVIDPAKVPVKTGSIYPEPYASMMRGRSSLRLGAAGGLTQFGANLVSLEPGALCPACGTGTRTKTNSSW
jgi:hypothetical protein